MQNAILELSVVWSQVKNKSLMTSLNEGQREHNLLMSLLQVTSWVGAAPIYISQICKGWWHPGVTLRQHLDRKHKVVRSQKQN